MNIESSACKEQIDNIWQEILPAIEKMSESYPNIKPEPVFDFKFDPETKNVIVKLKELNLKIIEE